eukprot:351761-Chlamydomonas_euryale.AAC.2
MHMPLRRHGRLACLVHACVPSLAHSTRPPCTCQYPFIYLRTAHTHPAHASALSFTCAQHVPAFLPALANRPACSCQPTCLPAHRLACLSARCGGTRQSSCT